MTVDEFKAQDQTYFNQGLRNQIAGGPQRPVHGGVAAGQRCAMVEVGHDRRRAQGAGPDLLQPGASPRRARGRRRQARGGVAARQWRAMVESRA